MPAALLAAALPAEETVVPAGVMLNTAAPAVEAEAMVAAAAAATADH